MAQPRQNLARRVASLDHLSGGRAAGNVVTTVNADAAANFSARGHLGREERYARAEERSQRGLRPARSTAST
jgi:alkanesulfonate monooxygenase SsuD/methylene tetrahydromethanopterin reductase-like flavin-dependent oxidoreductase (luciferase family)